MSLLDAIHVLKKRGVKLQVTGSYHNVGRIYRVDYFWVDGAGLISLAEETK